MKPTANKDYCLWFIQPHDGRVRKLRFSPRFILGTLGVVAVGFLLVAFTAGDYARVQLLRAKNFFFLEQVTRERDELLSLKDALRVELESLKSETGRAQVYENNIKERLQELASVLEASRSLGLPDTKGEVTKKDGMGGAEADCGEGLEKCVSDVSSPLDGPLAMLSPAAMRRDIALSAHSQAELVALLDGYIAALRAFPLAPPARGRLSSGYGYRNSPFNPAKVKLHQGIDISLPHGSSVYSTGDGVVRSVKRNSTYGLVIDVEHTDRVISRYAHLSKALVAEGDKVHRGTVVGRVGSSGHSTGPHLHYEVLVDGRPKDPQKYLALAEKIATVFQG
jgi:murein DD-endopeptidase MepM/ murein hydrolase activator NlpD